MRKLFLVALAVLLMAPCAMAGELSLSEVLKKFPLKQGIAYSIADSQFNYLSTIEIASWKGLTLELGYAGAPENTQHKAVGVISYPVIKLEDFIDVPILKLVELNLGLYGGVGRIYIPDGVNSDNSNELDWGVSATLLNVKF